MRTPGDKSWNKSAAADSALWVAPCSIASHCVKIIDPFPLAWLHSKSTMEKLTTMAISRFSFNSKPFGTPLDNRTATISSWCASWTSSWPGLRRLLPMNRQKLTSTHWNLHTTTSSEKPDWNQHLILQSCRPCSSVRSQIFSRSSDEEASCSRHHGWSAMITMLRSFKDDLCVADNEVPRRWSCDTAKKHS